LFFKLSVFLRELLPCGWTMWYPTCSQLENPVLLVFEGDTSFGSSDQSVFWWGGVFNLRVLDLRWGADLWCYRLKRRGGTILMGQLRTGDILTLLLWSWHPESGCDRRTLKSIYWQIIHNFIYPHFDNFIVSEHPTFL
jgi:hypothetical protein